MTSRERIKVVCLQRTPRTRVTPAERSARAAEVRNLLLIVQLVIGAGSLVVAVLSWIGC